MKTLAVVTAVPVAAAGVAAGEWFCVVYVAAVLYTLFGWRPRWFTIPLPRRAIPVSDFKREWRSLQVSRAILIPAAIAIVLLTGNAYVDVFRCGDRIGEAITLTLAALAAVLAALVAHQRVEQIEHQ